MYEMCRDCAAFSHLSADEGHCGYQRADVWMWADADECPGFGLSVPESGMGMCEEFGLRPGVDFPASLLPPSSGPAPRRGRP